MILGGFVLLGATLALAVRVDSTRELAHRAWDVGGELASHGLGALLLLWLGSPIAALRRDEVLQEVRSSFACALAPEEALARLRRTLEQEELEVEVEQHLRVEETRDGHELARATLLRASSPDPFERWSTSFAGPVRETPRIWVTLVEGIGGGSRLQLSAGLYDPREPQLERATGTLRRIRQALDAP